MKQLSSNYSGNENRKLFAYSSSAVLFIASAPSVFSQVMYTDVDPDLAIEAPGGIYDLDLNGDAISDFTFSATSVGSNIITSLGANVFYGINGVFINPGTSNSVAATSGTQPGFAYPYVLASSVNVGGGQLFINESFQTLAYSFFASHDGVVNPIQQYGQWLGGETNKFVGLKFLISGSVHYGWARLDVDSSNNKLTLKDYAYEDTPNTAIHTEIGVAIEDETINDLVNIYSFGTSLFIVLKDHSASADVSVYDLAGKQLIHSKVNEEMNMLDLSSLPASAYIVKVQTVKGVAAAQVSVMK